MDLDKLNKIVPDGIKAYGHYYILDKKCKFIKIKEAPVYIPLCNKDIILQSVSKHWNYCPFCGGRLFDVEADAELEKQKQELNQ